MHELRHVHGSYKVRWNQQSALAIQKLATCMRTAGSIDKLLVSLRHVLTIDTCLTQTQLLASLKHVTTCLTQARNYLPHSGT